MDKKFKLLSSDNEVFEVEASVLLESQVLKIIIEEDMKTIDAIPLETVRGKVLAQVIEYCQYHAALRTKSDGHPAFSENEVKKWNAQFINMDRQALSDLMKAANFLIIPSLLKIAREAYIDMMIDKNSELGQILNIKTAF